MTEAPQKTEPDLERRKFKTYRDRRLFWVMLSTAVLLFTCDPFAMLFSHPISALFWDWWYFSFRKVKESSTMPEWYLEMKKISPEQVDKYVRFSVIVRRVAFLAAITWLIINFMVLDNWNGYTLIRAYAIGYIGGGLIMGCAILFRIIKYPYMTGRDVSRNKETLGMGGMTDPNNTMGWYNAMSPNYVFNSSQSPFSNF